MSRSAAVLWGPRLPIVEYGTSDKLQHTNRLKPVTPGSRPGGSSVTFQQAKGQSTVTSSQMSSGGNASIRVTQPSALLKVGAVLGKGSGFPSSVMDDEWELTIMQTVESNDDRRYYGATNRGKDFYIECQVSENREFPILNVITSPPEQTAPAGDPSYSVTSMASFDPRDIGAASDSLRGATTGTIYAQFEPSIEARCIIPFTEHPDTFRNHGLTAPRYYLTEIQKNAKIRTWLSTRDKRTGDVYPQIMLEHYFRFDLQVKVNDNAGKDINYRFIDCPVNVLLPRIYLDRDARCLPIPLFPRAALKPDANGKFFVANNAFSWKTVFP